MPSMDRSFEVFHQTGVTMDVSGGVSAFLTDIVSAGVQRQQEDPPGEHQQRE